MNKVLIMGRLTKEIELHTSKTETIHTSFTLAVNRKFSKQGEEKQADFISCKAFGKTAENIAQCFKKGSMIVIVGRIQTGSYEKDDRKIYTTDVIVDEFFFTGEKREEYQESGVSSKNEASGFMPIDTNYELPF
jgi:single-strand DNA-binding protein